MRVGTKIQSVGNFEFFHYARPKGKRWKIRLGDKGQVVEAQEAIFLQQVGEDKAIFVRFGWEVFAIDPNLINEFVRLRD
ncbi:hypothetical protein [Schinkia azotoformans]|uniref:hypothetical protein n=1 Tax=Schinkia azotoformans TaxID=1454 RepID=UPI002DBA7C56|nr:hypothetical protein [Schinkia azotoformans]MEC1715000.1 hypothetical protein [Schinkia azotoformans]MEC1740234.1 hypothetical protein [Schinkia azotoformans]MEC1747143.1 hypothetical protein [Schinkia azotoformans]MEC1766121.1 hypothetical protein [Schinkia azotoformans]MEC1785331.1 hypothetical protein [Schinkia azotoformans]